MLGLDRFALYVFGYGAPVGFRIATRHPERITAIIPRNGNAYTEGLSDGWNLVQAHWKDPSEATREAIRMFLEPPTIWQYTHGVPDTVRVSPDGYGLDNYYLARSGADEIQLDLLLERRVERHVARVVEEQVELDLVGAAAREVVVVEPVAVRADPRLVGTPWVYCQIVVCGSTSVRIASRLAFDGSFQ